MGPVEESWFAPSSDYQPEENERSLQSKLQEEANYHLFGSRMDKQPRQGVAYNREEERKRRVSHDPFAQPRPYETVQNPGIKGLASSNTASPGSAVHQPAGLTCQPQGLHWTPYNPYDFRARPLGAGTVDCRFWSGPNANQIPGQHKTPVPETNLLGNTPTIPFISLASRGKQAFLSNLVFVFFPENKIAVNSVVDHKVTKGQMVQSSAARCSLHHEMVSSDHRDWVVQFGRDSVQLPTHAGFQVLCLVDIFHSNLNHMVPLYPTLVQARVSAYVLLLACCFLKNKSWKFLFLISCRPKATICDEKLSPSSISRTLFIFLH